MVYYNLSIYSTVDEHFGSFQVLAIMSTAAINTLGNKCILANA